MSGNVSLSWGRFGGFYVNRRRICLGWVAFTYIPVAEIDDLMRGYLDEKKMRHERDFLLARLTQHRKDVGASSTAMVIAAMTGTEPTAHPWDWDDYGRCERTYKHAPQHLAEAMAPILLAFSKLVAERYPDRNDPWSRA